MNTCFFCGLTHEHKCALIKAYEYYPDGKVKRIEFMTLNDLRPAEQPKFVCNTVNGSLQ